MFEALLDDDSDPGLAAAAEAPGPGPPAAAAPRQRHHGGVAAHSDATKLRMKAARQRRLADHHKAKTEALVSNNIESFSEHVASTAFGRKAPECRKLLSIGNFGTVALQTSKSGTRSNDFRICKFYGCVSAAFAQAESIHKFLQSDYHGGTLLSSVSIGSFDDAQMWMKDPCSKADRESGLRREGMKLSDGSLWRRGANVCLPVYNATEAIITRRSHGTQQILRSAIIHSPSQVLPEANTGTIANRRRRWQAAGIMGAGSRFDSQSVVRADTESSSWHTIVATKDNLALNDCVIGLDESVLKAFLDSGAASNFDTPTILSLSCAGHSAVLSTKEVSSRLDGTPSKMVRMGHQFTSGKTKAKFDQLVVDIITQSFEFIPVTAMPPESSAWKAHALNVLKISRPCLDLTVDDELFIVSVDNSDWTQPGWKHLCIGVTCICRGNPGFALKLMIKCGQLSIGKIESTPLEYRWKGMEVFAAKTFRGRQQHDILLNACLMIWPPSQTQRSEAALARLAELDDGLNGNLSNDALRHKANVRGGQTVDWMLQDTNGDMLKRCLLYNVGVQHFLNLCLKADELVTEYTNLLSRVPNELSSIDDLARSSLSGTAEKLRNKCIGANLNILSGAAADEALSIYSAFVDFCSSSWDGWTTPGHQHRFTICCDLIPVMQDIYFRLIHRMNIPKINILSVCSLDLDDDDDCDILKVVGSIVNPLLEKAARCDECVDFAFTLPWAHRLSGHGPATAKQAWLALGDIVSLLRVAATLVEKKHLVGQEAKPRKRGVCISADEVGGFVFHKLVEKAAEHCRAAATNDCLGKHVRQFSLCVNDLLAEGHADRRSESQVAADPDNAAGNGRDKAIRKRCRNILALDAKLKRQRVRGYDVYVRTNFTDELEGDSTFARRKLLDGKWKALSEAEKASYNAIAEAEDAEDLDHENDNFVEFLARSMEAGKKRSRVGIGMPGSALSIVQFRT